MAVRIKTGILSSVAVIAVFWSAGPASSEDNQRLADLSVALCGIADMYYGYEDAGDKIEAVLITFMRSNRLKSFDRQSVFDYWNSIDHGIICKSQSQIKPNARTPQHFLKRVVDLRMENQIFYEFLFFDSETHPDVDVNAVEMVDGKPETLLDYIDDIFAAGPERQSHYDLQQLAELREMLVEEYGAKTAAELMAAE